MATIVDFEIGCRLCENLIPVSKTTYYCIERVHIDDSPVIPIKDNIHTEDWYICSGDSYTRKYKK